MELVAEHRRLRRRRGCCSSAFVLVERRAAEPVLPLWVFSRRLLLTTTLVSLGVGAILIGLTSYVPTYLEGTIGVVPRCRRARARRPDARLADRRVA